MNSCSNCRWNDPSLGECRKNAPVVHVIKDAPQSRFPRVAKDDWCGDWRAPSGVFNQMQMQVMEFIEVVKASSDLAGIPASWPNDRIKQLCYKLIEEEVVKELLPAISADDWPAIVDGICDSLYVLFYLCNRIGINIQPFFDAVHRANMEKLGGPTDPETGKQLKPEGWKPPPIAELIDIARSRVITTK